MFGKMIDIGPKFISAMFKCVLFESSLSVHYIQTIRCSLFRLR